MTQMTGAMAGRQIFPDSLVEGQQPDGVALEVEKISERGSERVGVLRLGPAERAVGHRAAVIDEQTATQISLVLKLFNEVPVGAGVEAPVQVTWVVAGRVLAILGELHREAVIRTAMHPVPESLDDHPRAQLQVLDGHQRLRVDQRTGSPTARRRSGFKPGRWRIHQG